MDVSSFLGGRFLTNLDLPQPSQVWTIRAVSQEQIQTDLKVCLHFAEHSKPLGLNKVNLRVVAAAWGVQAANWTGKQIELLKDRCAFQGRMVDCIRLRVPPPQPYPHAPQLMTGPAPQQQPQQMQQPPGVIASPGSPPWGSL